MRSLIVPCAGGEFIENIPLYLNRHPDGSLLGVKAVQGIFPEHYDRIIYVILLEEEKNFPDVKLLQKAAKSYVDDVIVICLEHKTSGPAETVYEGIKRLGLRGEFAVRDSLNYISLNEECQGDFLVGMNLMKFKDDITELRSRSFIISNEQNQILDIIEKRLRSDIISVGYYGFNDVNDYIYAYEHLQDNNYTINRLYVSHIISYLIGYRQKIFHYKEVKDYEEWKTIEAWNSLQKNYMTLFVDVDTFNTNHEKINDLLMLLKSREKISCIFYSSDPKVDLSSIKSLCLKNGIYHVDVLRTFSHSNRSNIITSVQECNKILMS